jgi:hypothetical protein
MRLPILHATGVDRELPSEPVVTEWADTSSKTQEWLRRSTSALAARTDHRGPGRDSHERWPLRTQPRTRRSPRSRSAARLATGNRPTAESRTGAYPERKRSNIRCPLNRYLLRTYRFDAPEPPPDLGAELRLTDASRGFTLAMSSIPPSCKSIV